MSNLTPAVSSSGTDPFTSDRSLRSIEPGDLEVEICGPPGSGKTVLLASLYSTFSHKRMLNQFSMSADLREAHRRLIEGDGTEITAPKEERKRIEGEQMSNVLPVNDGSSRRIRITSSAGEDILSPDGVLDVASWVDKRKNKIVVVCLNPFRIDAEIAWKGLCHLIAVLQSDSIGLDFGTALNEACWTLFQIQSHTLEKKVTLKALVNAWSGTKIVYDLSQAASEDRFVWKNIDESGKRDLCEELKDLIDERNRLQDPLVSAVRGGLQLLDHSMVVLTHVDLIDALLPSITFTDIERVFNDLFEGRPERMVGQQALARLFDIKVKPLAQGSGLTGGRAGGMRGNLAAAVRGAVPPSATPDTTPPAPTAPTNVGGYAARGVLNYKLRRDGADQFVTYLRSMAAMGADTPMMQISVLTSKLNRAAVEVEAARRSEGQFQSELERTKEHVQLLDTTLAQERTERARAEGDAQQRTAQLIAKEREISDIKAQLAQIQGERDMTAESLKDASERLTQSQLKVGELAPSAETIKTLQAQLQLHQRDLQQAQALQAKLQTERDQMKARMTSIEQNAGGADAKIRNAEAQIQTLTEEKIELERKLLNMHGDLPGTGSTRLGFGLDDELTPTEKKEADGMKQRIRQLEQIIKGLQDQRLPPEEVRIRDEWENTRFPLFKQWCVVMLRALPVLPLVAGAAYYLLKGTTDQAKTPPHLFVLCSIITVVAVALAAATALGLSAWQLSPAWIKLRNMNTKTRIFEVLTSVGQLLTGSPTSFTLVKSPLLYMLGLAVIRRNDTGQKYITNEPRQWVSAPEKPRQRWLVLLDAATLIVVAVWILTMFTLS